MRVLWFTSGVSMYTEYKTSDIIGGAWINSLEREFRINNIILGIAFLTSKDAFEKKIYKDNVYYLLPGFKNNNKISRLYRKWRGKIEDEQFVVKSCMRVIDDFKPDIIHIFGSENPCGLITQYIKIPSILHIQGILTICFHKYFKSFSKKEIRKAAKSIDWIKRNPPFYHWKLYEKRSLVEKKILNNCSSFFGRTEWDRRIIQIFSPGSDYYYCSEILRDEFYITQWKRNRHHTFIIISVFQDDIYKGLEDVYDAALLLNKLNFNFKWKIAGISESSPLKRIVGKNRPYDLNKLPVELLGKLSTELLISELITSDLFVHPSHIDNSSNSVSEALMLGMPVLSTNVGGLPSLVQDNYTGYLVQDGDPWALAGAVISIFNNYQEAMAVGNQARQVSLVRHDKNNIFSTVIETYKTLIKKKRDEKV